MGAAKGLETPHPHQKKAKKKGPAGTPATPLYTSLHYKITTYFYEKQFTFFVKCPTRLCFGNGNISNGFPLIKDLQPFSFLLPLFGIICYIEFSSIGSQQGGTSERKRIKNLRSTRPEKKHPTHLITGRLAISNWFPYWRPYQSNISR